MSPRPYRLGARTAAVAETRERVVAAARGVFAEGGFHRSAVDEVARRADVARATVYHQFGNKLGLLEAVLVDFELRAGLETLIAVVERTPADELLRAAVTAGCAYWATDPVLARRILGFATVDPEAHELLNRHDAGRLRLLTRMVDRLAEGGRLRADCPPARALDILWLLTSFEAFDQLTRQRGLTAAEAAETLATMAEEQVGRR